MSDREKTYTNRGFALKRFVDQSGLDCSVQLSSLATEDCVWVGISKPKVQYNPRNNTGWHDVPMPEGDVVIDSRMHLTQEQAGWLAEQLRHFAETGDLPE